MSLFGKAGWLDSDSFDLMIDASSVLQEKRKKSGRFIPFYRSFFPYGKDYQDNDEHRADGEE
jgi:hypothetical protein